MTFNDSVKEVRNKRNIVLYESPWFIHKQTTRELHQVNALIKLSKEQKIKLGFKDYATFFDSISCAAGDDMYIKWECSPNEKTLCAHRQNFKTLKDELLLQCDSNLTTKMMYQHTHRSRKC